jgi:hypothetical protein
MRCPTIIAATLLVVGTTLVTVGACGKAREDAAAAARIEHLEAIDKVRMVEIHELQRQLAACRGALSRAPHRGIIEN